MRAAHFAFALLSLVAAVYAGGNVVALKGSNFETELLKHNLSLVKFFIPSCEECKALAKPFQEASFMLEEDDIWLFDVNCAEHKDLCNAQEINDYPMLKIFRHDQYMHYYDGPHVAEGIVEYMRNMTMPSSVELESVEAFDKFIHEDDYSVVGFFGAETKLKKAFERVASAHRYRFRFAQVTNGDVLKKTHNSDSIVVYVPSKLHNLFEPNEFKYEGEADVEKIERFLVDESSGLAGIFSPSSLFKFQKYPLVVAFYNLDFEKDLANTTKWRNYVLETAKSFKDKVSFAVANKSEFSDLLEKFGLGDRKDSDEPLVVMIAEKAGSSMFGDFSVESLKKFVTDALSGNSNESKSEAEKDEGKKDEL